MTRAMWVGAVLVGLAAGATGKDDDGHTIPADAKAILDKAETLELFSLDPMRMKDAPKDAFHGYKVLGKTMLKGDARKALAEAFEKGVTEYKGFGAKCFEPRHGIRATHDGKVADFVICFECSRVYAYVDKGESRSLYISGAPAKAFNKALADAGVPLPDQPDKK